MIRLRAFFFALPTLIWASVALADFKNVPAATIASVDVFHVAGKDYSATPIITFAGYHTSGDGGGGAVYALGAAGCTDNSGDILKDAAGNCFYATQPVQNLAQWGARCDAQNIKNTLTLSGSAPQIVSTTPLNANLRDGTAKVAVTDAGAAYATFASTITAVDGTGLQFTTAANPTQTGSLFISTKVNQITAPDGSWLNLPITNVTNDSGVVQITVASTAAMTNGLSYKIAGANMTIDGTSSIVNGIWVANIIDGTHFDLVDSTWASGDSYINGGQTNRASYGTGFKVGDTIVWSWDGVTPGDTTVVSKATDGGINTNILNGTQGAKITTNIVRGTQAGIATPLSTSGSGDLSSVGAIMLQGKVFQMWAGHDDGAAINNAFASANYDLHKPPSTTCGTTIPLVLPPNNSMICDRSNQTDFVALGNIAGTAPAGTRYTVYRANAVGGGGGMSGCKVDGMKLSEAAVAVLGGQLSTYANNFIVNGTVNDFQCGVASGTGIQITQDSFTHNHVGFDKSEFPLVSQMTPISLYDFGTCNGNYFTDTELSSGVIAWKDDAGFNVINGCEEQQQEPYSPTTGIIVSSHSVVSNCLLKNITGSFIYSDASSANISNNRLIPDIAISTSTTYGVELAAGITNTIVTGVEIAPNSGMPSDQYIHTDGVLKADNVLCNNPGAALATCLNGNSRTITGGKSVDYLSLLDETVNWASTSTAVKSVASPACSTATSLSAGGVSVSVYSNTGTLVNLTVPSTAKLVEGATYTIANVNATSNGSWPIHIVDGTHVTLTGSVYYAGDSYSGSGGSVGSGTISANKTYIINDDNGSGGSFATHNLTVYTITGTINGAATYVAAAPFRMTCDGVGNYAVK